MEKRDAIAQREVSHLLSSHHAIAIASLNILALCPALAYPATIKHNHPCLPWMMGNLRPRLSIIDGHFIVL